MSFDSVRRGPASVIALVIATSVLLGGCSPAGSWRSAAPASFARQEVAYVYSPSTGLFYLAGGRSVVQEAYDPDTDDWHDVAPLPRALDHIQAVEYDGLIYYIGGLVTWPGPAVGTVYVYDPVADQFTSGTPMLAGRERGAGGVAVHDGKIYYAGGLHDGTAVPWFDVYDPVARSWTVLPDMPRAKDHFHAAVVGDRFYAIGGRAKAIVATTTANDAFDLRSGSWITTLAPLPTARGGFATAVLGALVLVIGGEGGGATFAAVEAYDTRSDKWRALAPMPTARHGIQAAVCNGGVYIADGGTTEGGGSPTSVQEVYFQGRPAACGGAA